MFNPFKKVVETSDSIVKGFVDLGDYKPNWWQLGGGGASYQAAITSSAVYTCVSVLSQEVARLHITHYKNPDLSGRVEQYDSDLAKLMFTPNSYQTRSDFFLSLMYSLLMDGNAYCVATRNSLGKVINLTPVNPRAAQVHIVPETGEVYYSLSKNNTDPTKIDDAQFIPQRNMLHVRLFTPTHPLIGVSPLIACIASVEQGISMQADSTSFFNNSSKPAGILRTPKPLGIEQAKRLKDSWNSSTTGKNAGKVPVLDNDLQFQQMSISAADSQLIDQYGMTKKDIATVFRVPLYMVGEGENQFKTAEASQRDFVTRSLGFYLEHIEANLNQFFDFNGRTELLEFDVERGIMRPEYIARIEGLTKGVQGGIYSPNEARASESLSEKDGGDNLFMQRQNVPINMLGMDIADSVQEPEPEPENDEKKLRELLGLTND